MLRIVSGKLRGRKLRTLKGHTTRPTLEKTRETVFNILQSRYDLSLFDAYDLFAGSGALGFEAFSRGVKAVFFTEIDRGCVTLIKTNIQHLSLTEHCSIVAIDATRWIKKARWNKGPKLFLLDPPYQSNLAQEVLNSLGRADIPEGSVIVLETAKNKEPDYPGRFQLFRQKEIGKTRVDFLEIQQPIT